MDSDNTSTIVGEPIPSRRVQFWTILSFEIPSLACTIYLLYHLLSKARLRQALHNHVIIIFLSLIFLAEVIDNPLYLDAYLHHGRNSFVSSPVICLIWWLIDYGAYGSLNVFLAWASFERHILIFHYNRFLSTRRKRILFHYLPLGIISIYLSGFYIGVMMFAPCENTFNYELEACGVTPCYEGIPWLNIWDHLVNGTLCILIEAVGSISLLARTIYRRYRVQQSVHWRKHRKMTVQLLSISTLSLGISLPQALIVTIQNTVPGMADFASQVGSYFFYLTTFIVLLLPFICLRCLPELWRQQWLCFRRRCQRTVIPVT